MTVMRKAAGYVDPAFKDQLLGVLRVVVPVVLSYAAARGWLTTESLGVWGSAITDFVAAAATLGAVVWSFMKNRQASQISRVAGMSSVHRVIAAPEIADVKLKDDPKVVSK